LSGTRILIFTGNSSQDKENPAANYDLVSRLVRFNDSYSPTFLIRCVVTESVNKPLQFHVDTRSESFSEETDSDLISERNFREMEFWFVFMDSQEPELFKSWTPPKAENFLNLDYGHFTDVGTFKLRVGLNEFGAFVWVVQRIGGKDRLAEFWRFNQAKLRKLFNSAEMALETRAGQSPALTVKISDRSLRWLLCATVAEKLAFAKEMHGQYMAMINFVRNEA
jgi:hypothetical protein